MITFLFHPPGGLLNKGVADYAKEKNHAVVMWPIDAMDYHPFPAEKWVNSVIRKAQPALLSWCTTSVETTQQLSKLYQTSLQNLKNFVISLLLFPSGWQWKNRTVGDNGKNTIKQPAFFAQPSTLASSTQAMREKWAKSNRAIIGD